MPSTAIKPERQENNTPVFIRKVPWNGFTYNEYMSWDDEIFCELMDGIPYLMAPPSILHQEIVGEIHVQLKKYLKNKPCKVFVSPIGVRLFPEKNGKDKNIVLPDVVVVCDEKKLSDGKTINGPPDFAIEVVSPSSKGHDMINKRDLYKAAGVKEYWAVDEDKIYKYVLQKKVYRETVFTLKKGLAVEPDVLKGCVIRF